MKEVMVCVLELFKEVMNEKQKMILFVMYGNMMILIFRYFDLKFGFNEWLCLINSDIY